jgi:single-stranded-DNA-specific exonuclease
VDIICEKSALGNVWYLRKASFEQIKDLQTTHNLSFLTSNILASRGLTKETTQQFLSPTATLNFADHNSDHVLWNNVNRACECIKNAIDKKEKIGVFGDYDVDGIASTAIWKLFFDKFNLNIEIWLPHREENYGPTEEALNFFAKKQIQCLIMLDCGSNSRELINAFVQRYNCKIIVIDHHMINNLNNADNKKLILINPQLMPDTPQHCEYKNLCTGGLSFLLLQLLAKKFNINCNFALGLAALATVCDVMPMIGFNRYLTTAGLIEIETSPSLGLLSIIKKNNLKPPLTASNIAFTIGPCLNAAARMQKSSNNIAYEILITQDENRATALAEKLWLLNQERRALQEIAYKEAKERINFEDKIICIAGEWPAGIVGIIAAMLEEIMKKPCIIGSIQKKTDPYIKASARASNINIGLLIQSAVEEKVIESGGGHAAAGGLTAKTEQWENFRHWINEQAKDMQVQNKVVIDARCDLSNICKDYNKIGPYGPENEEPIILVSNIFVQSMVEMERVIRITILHQLRTHTFFVMKKYAQLIDALQIAMIKKSKIEIVIRLQDSGFHKIIDLLCVS